MNDAGAAPLMSSSPPRGLAPSAGLGTPASSLRFGALQLQAHPALPASSSSGDEINAVVAEYERDKESMAYVHVRRALLAPLRPSPPRALLPRSGSSGSSGSGGGGGGAPLQGGAAARPPRSRAPLLRRPEGLVFGERQVIVVIVFAGEKLEADPLLRIPSIDVELNAIFPKHQVPRNGIAPSPEEAGQQVTAFGL
jgi:hypothetical protein